MKGTNIWPRIFCCLLAEEKTWTNHIQSLVLLSFCVKMWESIVALHQNCSYYDVVFQFKERHATFLERKITLSITQQLEKRFAVKSLGVNICGGKTCTNPLTPYILENCLRGELLHSTALCRYLGSTVTITASMLDFAIFATQCSHFHSIRGPSSQLLQLL